MTAQNPKATYVCINAEQLYAPAEITEQSICLKGDIAAVLEWLL